MEIVMPLSMNLLCYNTVGKATWVMSKNIEPEFTKLSKLSQSIRKKFRQVIKLKIM